MLAYWAIRVSVLLSRILPLEFRYFLGAGICHMVYLTWRDKRRNAVRNAQVVMDCSPQQAARVAKAAWRNYGRYLIDFLRLPAVTQEHIIANVDIVGWEHLDAALDAGKGAIFVTAHYGCWDFGPTAVDHRYPGRVYLAAETFHPQRLNDLIQGHRLAKGATIIPAENGARRMMRTVRHNNVLALVMDRPVHGQESGVSIEFFGRRTMVPAGAATLAILTGAPLLPGYVRRRRDGRYEGAIGLPIYPKAGDREAEVRRLTQAAMSALEVVIRERPAQWYMFRPFWPEVTSLVTPNISSNVALSIGG